MHSLINQTDFMKTFALLALTACSYLSAETYSSTSQALVPQTEFEQLAVICTKYGNNPRGLPTLHYAILQNDEEAVDLLLKYGASPHTQSAKKSYKPDILHACVQSGNLALFKKFADVAWSTPELIEDTGTSVLLQAIQLHENYIANFILETYTFDLDDKLRFIPKWLLEECSRAGNYEIFNLLVTRYNGLHVNEGTCIRYALEWYNIPEEPYLQLSNEKALIKEKLKILDTFSNSELSDFFIHGHSGGSIISTTYPETLVYLLDRGIIHIDSIFHKTPLLYTACGNYRYGNEMVEILLSRGLDIHDEKFKYALFTLIDSQVFSEPVLRMKKELILTLVNAGLDVNHRDQLGKTVLAKTKDKNMKAFLKSLGAEK